VGRLFGYVLVAFFVAYVSAWLVTALSKVHLRVPVTRRILSASERLELIRSQILSILRTATIAAAQPRAPPAAPRGTSV